jgi:hypothetical protein
LDLIWVREYMYHKKKIVNSSLHWSIVKVINGQILSTKLREIYYCQKDLHPPIEHSFFVFEPLKMYVCYGATYHSA